MIILMVANPVDISSGRLFVWAEIVQEEHGSSKVTPRMFSAFLFLLGLSVLARASETPAGAPPTPVFDPYRFGAKGDGASNDQLALQRAIDACKGSGGSVFLHDGRFLTGQITLRSNMTLYIAPSATLVGIRSTSEAEYPSKSGPKPNRINEACQRRLIYGENLDRVAITGGGTLDGQGDFWPWVSHGEKIPERMRPSLIEIANSRVVEVTDLNLLRSGMWTQVYLECTGLVLRGLTVDTGDIPSNRTGWTFAIDTTCSWRIARSARRMMGFVSRAAARWAAATS
jgi:polygalacturonase